MKLIFGIVIIVAIITIWLKREFKTAMIQCMQCGWLCFHHVKSCPQCGNKLKSQRR